MVVSHHLVSGNEGCSLQSVWLIPVDPALSGLKISFIIICNYTVAVFRQHQKRASDLITDGCEPPCGCWDLNSGPLEEQSVLLTPEPSLQPVTSFLYVSVFCLHACISVLSACLSMIHRRQFVPQKKICTSKPLT